MKRIYVTKVTEDLRYKCYKSFYTYQLSCFDCNIKHSCKKIEDITRIGLLHVIRIKLLFRELKN